MIEKNYLNPNGQRLFDSFEDGLERDWAWEVVRQLRQRYPTADQWTTGGPDKSYIDLRFGNRRPQKTSASAVLFRLCLENGGPTCRVAWWIAKHQPTPPLMTSETHPTPADITAWLETVAPVIKPYLNRLDSAQGCIPLDYADSPAVDMETDADEAVVAPPAQATTESTAGAPPLNTILYGPPGTGKTYATIDEALAILDPSFLDEHPEVPGMDAAARSERRRQLKERFDALAEAGQVRFVTFHQSFSYEDFVEGLRAVPAENGGVRYDVVDGVFKALCDSAAARVTKPHEVPPTISLEGRRIWKMSLGNSVDEVEIYDECMEKGVALLGWGGGINFAGCKTQKDLLDRFAAHGKPRNSGDYEVTAVTHFVLKMKPGDLIVVTEGNYKFRAIGEVTGDYRHLADEEDFDQCREVRWLCRYEPSQPYERLMNKQFIMKTLYQLHPGSIDLQKLKHLLEEKPTSEDPATPSDTPHLLIIDEINRGNVSRIFGELITLIESSKRAGADEALSVTLPYSKLPFSVPKNVHLLGTMNTADRSLAGLDIALRRRFVFKEMPPRPELLDAVEVDGVNIGALLRAMNARIEVLLDREHCLGHAWFMALTKEGENTLAALAGIFRNQVLPLLQEYFFEDWERIGWVLNDHRKQKNPARRFVVRPKSDLKDLFGDETAGRLQDRRWTLNTAAFDDIESYRQILQGDA